MSSAVPGRRKVRSQEELNEAIADGVATIYVDSPPDVWLMIAHQRRSNIIVIGSSKIVARDSVHIEASAHVAIHRVSPLVTARGGVVIDIASLDLTDPAS